MSEDKTIDVPVWWLNGNGGMFRRDCLPVDHPEHTYNYIKNPLGEIPENYNCTIPKIERCPHCGEIIKITDENGNVIK